MAGAGPMMSTRISPRQQIALMSGYHSPQLAVDVRLNTNESPLPPPHALTERLADALETIEWHRYPDRSAGRLRSAIGDLHGVSASRVFAANGSNEVLQSLLLTYGGAGRSAAIFEPTYALHSHLSRVTGTTVAEGERGDGFELDLDEVKRVLTEARPSITFLCSPNNPTGVVDSLDDISAVLEMVTAGGGLLCVDEAYGQFARDTAQQLMSDDVPLVVTRTYSKTWAMAGARIGYLLAPEWVIDDLEKVVLPYHLDSFTQLAGTIALDYEDEMQQRIAALVAERIRLDRELADLPVDTWPSGANFILMRPRAAGGDDVWQGLVDRSVLVRNCSSWPRLQGCLRVTVGAPEDNDRFLTALREVIS
jgi:histidinol-phosphate aminotransferase